MNEYQIKLEINKIMNGGAGSGNHNPGQGRGVGKPGNGTSKFSKGQEVEFEYGGGKGTGKVLRKLSDKEKKDRAFLANPDAGDYYEVETDDGYKTIVWDAKIKEKSKESKRKEYLASEPSEEIREKARKAIIEVDPEYDYDQYDELVEHAFDLVDRADSVKELKEILESEYGGFFTTSDIDEILEID